MYISIVPVAALLSVVAAQTTYSASGTSSACAAQPVLEACLASTEAIVANCDSTDYSCLCSKWTDVVTCFLQCPNDPRYASVYSSEETFCNDAKAYSSTASTSSAISRAVSSAVSAPVTTTASGTATKSAGAVAVATSSASGATASASASSTAKSGASKDLAVNLGGVVMGLAGLVGAFL